MLLAVMCCTSKKVIFHFCEELITAHVNAAWTNNETMNEMHSSM